MKTLLHFNHCLRSYLSVLQIEIHFCVVHVYLKTRIFYTLYFQNVRLLYLIKHLIYDVFSLYTGPSWFKLVGQVDLRVPQVGWAELIRGPI